MLNLNKSKHNSSSFQLFSWCEYHHYVPNQQWSPITKISRADMDTLPSNCIINGNEITEHFISMTFSFTSSQLAYTSYENIFVIAISFLSIDVF